MPCPKPYQTIISWLSIGIVRIQFHKDFCWEQTLSLVSIDITYMYHAMYYVEYRVLEMQKSQSLEALISLAAVQRTHCDCLDPSINFFFFFFFRKAPPRTMRWRRIIVINTNILVLPSLPGMEYGENTGYYLGRKIRINATIRRQENKVSKHKDAVPSYFLFRLI